MTDIYLPSLAGIARALPVRDGDQPTNVGAGWSVTPYTVPVGRAAIITTALLAWQGGTEPNQAFIRYSTNGPTGTDNWTVQSTLTAGDGIHPVGALWLSAGESLRFLITGGDATTDLIWGFSGLEFDWEDVS